MNKLLELAAHDAAICSGCGFHKSLTTDLANQFAIEVEHCNVCAATAKWDRIQKARDDKAVRAMGKNPAPAMKRPDDGRHTVVRLKAAAELADRAPAAEEDPSP